MLAGHRDEAPQHRPPDAGAAEAVVDPHRLELAASAAEVLEGPDAGELVALPGREERDRRVAQLPQVQSVAAVLGGVGVHALEVQGDERLGRGATEVVFADLQRHGVS